MNKGSDYGLANGPMISAPKVSLPNSGAGLNNISQKFQPHLLTGSGTYSYNLAISKARALTPSITLTYSTGFGNGAFGQGFNLNYPLITRKTHNGVPSYDDNDIFIWQGEDLIKKVGNSSNSSDEWTVTYYVPRIVRDRSSIEYWNTQDNKNSHWVVRAPEGVNYIFGSSANSRVADPTDPSRVFNWLLQETIDAQGNRVSYRYFNPTPDDKNPYVSYALQEIQYGNYHKKDNTESFAFRLYFDYGKDESIIQKLQQQKIPISLNGQKDRDDAFVNFRAGFGIINNLLCHHAIMFHQFESQFDNKEIAVNYWTFTYSNTVTDAKPLAFLESVQRTGCYYREDTKNYLTRSAAKETFTYAGFSLQPLSPKKLRIEDPNDSSKSLPADISKLLFIDLYREGLPGILYSDNNTTLYWRNRGIGVEGSQDPQFEKPIGLSKLPIHRGMGVTRYHLQDIEANHSLNLMVINDNSAGYYTLDNQLNWSQYKILPNFPSEYLSYESQMIDLMGSGKSDIVVFQHGNPRYYPNRGLKGFGPITKVNISTAADFPSASIPNARKLTTFANIFGDGLSHRVQVSYNSIAVWPNLGCGKFGAKILLSESPEFEKNENDFHPNTLQFVDVDGSGLDSLVYFNTTGMTIYLNQGMKFSKTGKRFEFPSGLKYSLLDRIQFIDLFGQGKANMLFIQNGKNPLFYYFDLCPEFKPYVLTQINNGIGAITKLDYASSIDQYLEDKKTGRQSLSRLPFPVTVLKSISMTDTIGKVTVTDSFKYHDGYFDPVEREFNGFGLVEHADKDSFEKSAQESTTTPIITKLWYHTGAQHITDKNRHYTDQYSNEYFKGDPSAYPMPDSTVSLESATAEDYTQICYTLRGSLLRQEIYSYAQGSTEANPSNMLIYSADQHNYTITQVQSPQSGKTEESSKPGCYKIQARESISYEYDGYPNDPVVHHQLFLQYDDYNNCLQEVTLAYPRRNQNHERLKTDLEKCMLSSDDFKRIPDVNVLELVVAINDYANIHKNNPSDATGNTRFNHHGLIKSTTLLDIPKPEITLSGKPEDKNTVFDILAQYIASHQNDAKKCRHKIFFYTDSTKAQSTVVEDIESIDGIPLLHHTEQAVMTDSQARAVYGSYFGELTQLLQNECGYILRDSIWYQSSFVQQYDNKKYFLVSGQTHLDELKIDSTSSLWHKSELVYDDYGLAIISVKRYLNDKAVEKNPKLMLDYRTLQPCQLVDVNDIKTEALIDPLGVVIATTISGSIAGQKLGKSLQNRDQMLDELLQLSEKGNADLQIIIAQRDTYLNTVFSSMLFYSTEVKSQESVPIWTLSFTRQADENPLTSFNVPIPSSEHATTVKYFNGFGKATQTKKLAHQNDWLVSGFKIYNDKGLVMHQYLPAWASSVKPYEFEPEQERLKKNPTPPTINYYDGLNRITKVSKPDGSSLLTKISPWYVLHYDENDTDENSRFVNTPSIQLLDALGHDIANATILCDEKSTKRELLVTHFSYDSLKQLVSERDPKLPNTTDNITYTYNMLGTVIKTDSVDRKIEVFLYDRYKNRIYYHDGRYRLKSTFDQWQRPITTQTEKLPDLSTEDTSKLVQQHFQVIERIEYGTEIDAPNNANEKIICKIDQAGLLLYELYNLRGKSIKETRFTFSHKEITEAEIFTDLTNVSIEKFSRKEIFSDEKRKELKLTEPLISKLNLDSLPLKLDRLPLKQDLLSLEFYFNNKGQIIAVRYPDQSIEVNGYNAMSQLMSVEFYLRGELSSKQSIVTDIQYNVTNQTKSKKFSDNLVIKYDYDDKTLRLKSINTTRLNSVYQDIQYTYDKVGNITNMVDKSLANILLARDDEYPGTFNYGYDSLYRVVSATARQVVMDVKDKKKEGGNLTSIARSRYGLFAKANLPAGNSANSLLKITPATENLTFDKGDNVTEKALVNDKKEEIVKYAMTVDSNSNQLTSIKATGECQFETKADYDKSGNMQTGFYDTASKFTWSYKNQLIKFEGEGKQEYYRYTSIINRMMSVSVNGATITEAIHLRSFTIHRVYVGDVLQSENYTLHVGDHMQQVASYSYNNQGEKTNEQLVYHLTNHLNSVCMDVLENGQVLNYEEFLAFGDTSFVVTAEEYDFDQKHYRYSSHKRNKDNGLYFYGARYFAPWLGKWVSPDPIGIKDALNEFEFVRDRPESAVDKDGFSFHTEKANQVIQENGGEGSWWKAHELTEISVTSNDGSLKTEKISDITKSKNYAIEVTDKNKIQYFKDNMGKIRDIRHEIEKEFGAIDSTTHYMFHEVKDGDKTRLFIFSSGIGQDLRAGFDAQKEAHTEAFAAPFVREKKFKNSKFTGELERCSKCYTKSSHIPYSVEVNPGHERGNNGWTSAAKGLPQQLNTAVKNSSITNADQEMNTRAIEQREQIRNNKTKEQRNKKGDTNTKRILHKGEYINVFPMIDYGDRVIYVKTLTGEPIEINYPHKPKRRFGKSSE